MLLHIFGKSFSINTQVNLFYGAYRSSKGEFVDKHGDLCDIKTKFDTKLGKYQISNI